MLIPLIAMTPSTASLMFLTFSSIILLRAPSLEFFNELSANGNQRPLFKIYLATDHTTCVYIRTLKNGVNYSLSLFCHPIVKVSS